MNTVSSYELSSIVFENDSEIVGEIDNSLELSFIYKNGIYYIEYYDEYDEDYFLIEIENDMFPLKIEDKEITLREFNTFKEIVGV